MNTITHYWRISQIVTSAFRKDVINITFILLCFMMVEVDLEKEVHRDPQRYGSINVSLSHKLPFSPPIHPWYPSKKSHFVYPAVPPKSKHIQLPNHLYQPHHLLHFLSSSIAFSHTKDIELYSIYTYKALVGLHLCSQINPLELWTGWNHNMASTQLIMTKVVPTKNTPKLVSLSLCLMVNQMKTMTSVHHTMLSPQ